MTLLKLASKSSKGSNLKASQQVNCGTTVSLNIALLVSSMLCSVPIMANSLDNESQEPTNKIQSITPNLILLPINNELFLYGKDALNFDLDNYLSVNAPLLLSSQETIRHWSGFYSINPKVVLALMESYSEIISAPNEEKLLSPFGRLSAKSGLSEQIQDVLFQLSNNFYQYEQSQLRLSDNSLHQQAFRNSGSQFAATIALDLLEGNVITPKNAQLSADEQGNKHFSTKFSQLFNTMFNQELQPNSSTKLQKSPVALSRTVVPPQHMMQLPWRIGYSWKSNGAHSHTGSGYPYSSIDVSYDWPQWGSNTYSVTAAHNGQVNILSRCQVRVTNTNGWATNYYHLDNIEVNNGQYVDANTKLGVYANNRNAALCEGGSSTGPHLHFSLLKNGRYVSLEGVNFGEYRINIGNFNYDNSYSRFYFSNLNNNGYKCAWSQMYNSGTY
ncbi:MAG: LasA protease [Alteromonadaceae bacterium]|jgi:LasA protease